MLLPLNKTEFGNLYTNVEFRPLSTMLLELITIVRMLYTTGRYFFA
jgi:hypothetical protein